MLYHYSIMGTVKATDLCKTIEKYSKSAKKMKKCAKREKPPLSKGGSASGISCPFCSRLSVQLLGKNRHQYQHQQQDKGIQLHRDILRQNAEKR